MIDINTATDIVLKNLPGWRIQKSIVYRDLFIFQVFNDDPYEGDQDPFFSVNRKTGEFRDFSVITDGDIVELTRLFLADSKE